MENIVGVADTGFLVALLNRQDKYHPSAVKLYQTFTEQVLLPQTVLAEVAYLVGKFSHQSLLVFLRGLALSRFELYALTEPDLVFVANILEQYTDSRIDFVDATVMAVAERFRIQTILTVDHRDFLLYRPQNVDYFTILPTLS